MTTWCLSPDPAGFKSHLLIGSLNKNPLGISGGQLSFRESNTKIYEKLPHNRKIGVRLFSLNYIKFWWPAEFVFFNTQRVSMPHSSSSSIMHINLITFPNIFSYCLDRTSEHLLCSRTEWLQQHEDTQSTEC